MKKNAILVILAVCCYSSVAFAANIQPPATFDETGKIVNVVDGDTVDVRLTNGKVERLRLIGINTPETKDPRKPVECFGKEASKKADKLLNGKDVSLERDDSQQNRDKYNRLLRYVWIDGKMLFNLLMIQEGYAYEYTYDVAYKYQQEFKAAQQAAEKVPKGLWRSDTCAGELKSAESDSAESPTTESKQSDTKEKKSEFSCSPKKTCKEMVSCDEAYFRLKECGQKQLDRDKDSVPCENICPGG